MRRRNLLDCRRSAAGSLPDDQALLRPREKDQRQRLALLGAPFREDDAEGDTGRLYGTDSRLLHHHENG